MEKVKVVGIVGGEGETHSVHMKNLIKNLGGEVIFFDTLNFPETKSFSIIDDEVSYCGEKINHLDGLYNRIVFYSDPPYDLQEKIDAGYKPQSGGWYTAFTAEKERQSLLGSWIRTLSFRVDRVVNRIESFQLHYLKPYQLVLLRRAGIVTPATL